METMRSSTRMIIFYKSHTSRGVSREKQRAWRFLVSDRKKKGIDAEISERTQQYNKQAGRSDSEDTSGFVLERFECFHCVHLVVTENGLTAQNANRGCFLDVSGVDGFIGARVGFESFQGLQPPFGLFYTTEDEKGCEID